jgi:vitamin B12 transport system ATP-binding protein
MLDEPAAPLDIGQEGLLYKLIRTVADMGIAVVMSNHDLNRTLHNADKVLMLDNGVLQQWGTPEYVLSEEELARVFKTSVTKAWVNDKPVLIFE